MSATSIRRPSEAALSVRVDSRLRGLVLAGGLVLVLLASAVWATHSPAFRLRDVSVSGQRHLSAGEVERLAGLSSSTNVFWTSPADLARRLERSPWIASARISRSLPSTLRISIRERTPVAVLPGRQKEVVAADGVVLEPASRTAAATLPLIVAGGRAVGPQSAGAAAQTRLALGAVGELDPFVRRQIATVSVGTGPVPDVVLKLRSGTLVHFGDDAQAGEKARVLHAMLVWARRHDVRAATIDVESPTSPSLLRAP